MRVNCKTEIVEVSASGRCDRVLRNSLISGKEWLSRASWDWLFRERKVCCNGKILRAGDTVSAGDRIEVALPGPLDGVLLADGVAEVIARGKDWIFVNKAAGIPTLCQLPWDTACFVNQVARLVVDEQLLTQKEFSLLSFPPILEGGLVQRLDNDTSGGILVALSNARKTEFRQLIGASQIEKTYLAIVRGIPKMGEFLFWLDEAVPGKKMRASQEKIDGALRAVLNIHVVSQNGNYALVRATTAYGMRHVVRASLAELGTPICGDVLYGGVAPLLDFYPYHLLHAETVNVPDLKMAAAPIPLGFKRSLVQIGLQEI